MEYAPACSNCAISLHLYRQCLQFQYFCGVGYYTSSASSISIVQRRCIICAAVDECINSCKRSYLCERAYGTLCAGGITVFRNECAPHTVRADKSCCICLTERIVRCAMLQRSCLMSALCIDASQSGLC